MQKKRLVSLTAAAVMAMSSAAAVVPASADTDAVGAAAQTTIEAKTATLKFNANGGTVMGAKKKTYKKGKTLGVLPNAKKNGYAFDGWFTAKTGGKRVNYNTKLAKCANKTFYAHWKKADVPHLTYKWSNSFEGFKYPSNYYSPKARYTYLYDKNFANFVWNTYATDDYGNPYGWGGNCFGMSSTATFNTAGKENIKTFNKKATFTKNLGVGNKSAKLKLTAGQYCEVVQMAQYNGKIQKLIFGEEYSDGTVDYNHNGDVKGLVAKVRKCQKGKGLPVVVCMFSYLGGHAVVGYKVQTVDKYTDRLYIYDCNYPNNKNRYITLSKNASGNYYKMDYEDYYAISYIESANVFNVWKNRGKKSASGYTNEERARLHIDSANATVYDKDGNVFCTVKDGIVQEKNVIQYRVIADKLDAKNAPVVIALPDGDFTVKAADGSAIGCSVYVKGQLTKGKGAAVAVNSFTGVVK